MVKRLLGLPQQQAADGLLQMDILPLGQAGQVAAGTPHQGRTFFQIACCQQHLHGQVGGHQRGTLGLSLKQLLLFLESKVTAHPLDEAQEIFCAEARAILPTSFNATPLVQHGFQEGKPLLPRQDRIGKRLFADLGGGASLKAEELQNAVGTQLAQIKAELCLQLRKSLILLQLRQARLQRARRLFVGSLLPGFPAQLQPGDGPRQNGVRTGRVALLQHLLSQI